MSRQQKNILLWLASQPAEFAGWVEWHARYYPLWRPPKGVLASRAQSLRRLERRGLVRRRCCWGHWQTTHVELLPAGEAVARAMKR